MKIKANYDYCSGINFHHQSYHTPRSKAKDLQLVIDELQKSGVFDKEKGRKHSQFSKFKGNTLSGVKMSDLKPWLITQLKKMIIYTK